MITFLQGTLTQAGPEAVVAVGDGGIGLDVLLSTRGAAQLPAVGEKVRLWTHLVTREDGWVLYGFPASEERVLFRLLIGVSGIGPKLALGILSGASPEELALFLRTGDEASLAKLPGIGRRSAARLVVELGQRLPAELPGPGGDTGGVGAGAEDLPLQNAVAVLMAMGLPAGQAERALLTARSQDGELAENLESWVRAALATL